MPKGTPKVITQQEITDTPRISPGPEYHSGSNGTQGAEEVRAAAQAHRMTSAFYFPGKAGDAILQWPVAYHWAKQNAQKIEVWLDRKSCQCLENLFRAQSIVADVRLFDHTKNYSCGGQPWQGDFTTADHIEHTIIPMGLHAFPKGKSPWRPSKTSRSMSTLRISPQSPSLSDRAKPRSRGASSTARSRPTWVRSRGSGGS